MTTCARCQQALLPAAKFCPSCGLAVAKVGPDLVDPLATTAPADPETLAALRRGEEPPKKSSRGATKPLPARAPAGREGAAPPEPQRSRGVAKTVSDSDAMPNAGAGVISPLAVSGPFPSHPPVQGQPPSPAPSEPRMSSSSAVPPAGVAAPSPGQRVLVDWSNGQKYPGTVQQSSPGKCLVLFGDGQAHWIDVRHVSVAQG